MTDVILVKVQAEIQNIDQQCRSVFCSKSISIKHQSEDDFGSIFLQNKDIGVFKIPSLRYRVAEKWIDAFITPQDLN